MLSSFHVSLALLVLAKNGVHLTTHVALLATIAVTTLSWLVTAFVGPETDRQVLVEFYKRVRPFGPGWAKVREEAGIPKDEARTTRDNIPLALLGWVAGCTVIWSALFCVGNYLYGRLAPALLLLGVFAVSGLALLYVGQRLWADDPEES
jgi:hypothetical protein